MNEKYTELAKVAPEAAGILWAIDRIEKIFADAMLDERNKESKSAFSSQSTAKQNK